MIDFVKQTFIQDLIEPLQEQINEIRSKRDEKETELKKSEEERIALENKKRLIATQLEEIVKIKSMLI
ncbi:MAG: hypothetical protein HUJ74_04410 [Lachnospiraceae bacterium]|nr:hypothetical protein [Lachnospiraceae bacterium]